MRTYRKFGILMTIALAMYCNSGKACDRTVMSEIVEGWQRVESVKCIKGAYKIEAKDVTCIIDADRLRMESVGVENRVTTKGYKYQVIESVLTLGSVAMVDSCWR